MYKVNIEARYRSRRGILAWRTRIVHQRERIPLTIPLDGGEPLICVDIVFDSKDGIEVHCHDGLNLLMRFYLAFPVEPDSQVFELPLTRRKKLRIEIVRQSVPE
jgi:hypothetical protein